MPSLYPNAGLWSATPTPFTKDYEVDVASVHRMVNHHIERDVSGMMLSGTCGEGAWMRNAEIESLTRNAVEAGAGKIRIALQVTDNSARRVLDNIHKAVEWGAEIAVVSFPYLFMNATPERLLAHYQEIIRKSPLPVIYYDRGPSNAYALSDQQVTELMAEPNTMGVKDSSAQVSRRDVYLQARKARPELLLLNGDEFNCVSYLKAGYNGLMLGGGIFNASLGIRMINAVRNGNIAEAEQLQERMNDLMIRVYGGPKIECWLTGLKELLVQMGIFSNNLNLLGYPLTEHCRAQIAAAVSGEDGLGYRNDLLSQ